MDLETFWFCVVAVVWAMYFLLEGFDFGVGMLLPFVPRSDEERSTALRTIGPVWDGNEVWLVVAGGATFAAFPAWYATMFSGFYLALLLILVFLIVRVVSFEWRSKSETPGWRSTWTWANTIGSFGASLLWGIGLSSPPVRRRRSTRTATSPGTSWICSARTACSPESRSWRSSRSTARPSSRCARRASCATAPRRSARRLAIPAAVLAAAYLAWTVAVAMDRNDKDLFPPVLPAALGIAALALAIVFLYRGTQRAGIRDDGARDDLARGDAVLAPLPARDGVEHRLREQPHRRQRRVVALRAPGDDRRGGDLRPARPPVPGLGVLRLPRAPRRRRRSRRTQARPRFPRLEARHHDSPRRHPRRRLRRHRRRAEAEGRRRGRRVDRQARLPHLPAAALPARDGTARDERRRTLAPGPGAGSGQRDRPQDERDGRRPRGARGAVRRDGAARLRLPRARARRRGQLLRDQGRGRARLPDVHAAPMPCGSRSTCSGAGRRRTRIRASSTTAR